MGTRGFCQIVQGRKRPCKRIVFRRSLKKGKTRNIDFQTEDFPIKTLYLKTKPGKTRKKKDLIEINGLEL